MNVELTDMEKMSCHDAGKKVIKKRRIATKEEKDAMMQECVDNYDHDNRCLPSNFAMTLEKKYSLSAKNLCIKFVKNNGKRFQTHKHKSTSKIKYKRNGNLMGRRTVLSQSECKQHVVSFGQDCLDRFIHLTPTILHRMCVEKELHISYDTCRNMLNRQLHTNKLVITFTDKFEVNTTRADYNEQHNNDESIARADKLMFENVFLSGELDYKQVFISVVTWSDVVFPSGFIWRAFNLSSNNEAFFNIEDFDKFRYYPNIIQKDKTCRCVSCAIAQIEIVKQREQHKEDLRIYNINLTAYNNNLITQQIEHDNHVKETQNIIKHIIETLKEQHNKTKLSNYLNDLRNEINNNSKSGGQKENNNMAVPAVKPVSKVEALIAMYADLNRFNKTNNVSEYSDEFSYRSKGDSYVHVPPVKPIMFNENCDGDVSDLSDDEDEIHRLYGVCELSDINDDEEDVKGVDDSEDVTVDGEVIRKRDAEDDLLFKPDNESDSDSDSGVGHYVFAVFKNEKKWKLTT